jgi:hypothetical protein
MYIMKSLQTRLSGYMEAGGTSFNGLSVHMSHWELGPACFDNDRIDKHQAANGGGIKQLYRTALQLSIFPSCSSSSRLFSVLSQTPDSSSTIHVIQYSGVNFT